MWGRIPTCLSDEGRAQKHLMEETHLLMVGEVGLRGDFHVSPGSQTNAAPAARLLLPEVQNKAQRCRWLQNKTVGRCLLSTF